MKIKFGIWSHHNIGNKIYDRLYFTISIWTPFVEARPKGYKFISCDNSFDTMKITKIERSEVENNDL